MSSHRAQLEAKATEDAKAAMERQYLLLNELYLRDVDPNPNREAYIQSLLAGQQALSQREFERQQAEVVARTEQIKYEAQQRQATFVQQQENERQILKAQADAQVTLATAQAQAEANQQIARSLTPDFIQYTRWSRWNGQMPTTVMGEDANVLIQR
jgi:hypothetical protein